MGDRAAFHTRTRIGFPNAKVNVGLQVRNRRPDGFHAIESLFVPIPWCDTLELEVLEDEGPCEIEAHGLPIPGNPDDNLIIKAHALLARDYNVPSVRFHLIKAIPMGAGLGGGSADGVMALQLLNAQRELGLSDAALEIMAAQLGSDCPFFIRNTFSHVSGRGEVIHPISIDLNGWWIAILHPGIHVSTAKAFSWVTPSDERPGLSTWSGSGPEEWAGKLTNDFTAPVIEHHPEVGHALSMLRNLGATHADMSGSGSAVFGFFRSDPGIDLQSACPAEWHCWSGRIDNP